jgi:hypothetical protein
MSWKITPQQPVPVDPIYGNVSLLLHGNESGGQFIDSSPTPKIISKRGNAAPGSPGGGTPIYPSGNSSFGNAIAFDGTGDYLTADFTIDWKFLHDNSTSWTAELWHYRNTNLTGSKAIFETDSRSAEVGLVLFSTNNFAGDICCYITRGASGSIFVATSAQAVLQANTWQHIAVVFEAGSTALLTIYVNGVQAASSSTTTFNFSKSIPTNTLNIGRSFSGSSLDFNGYIDDLRITKGIARYTANFTPPTAPFPDA